MMGKHEGSYRGFTQLSKAWYADANLKGANFKDSVTFGFYYEEGGTSGEISVKWVELGGKITPKMTVYDDAWDALNECKDILPLLAEVDEQDISPEQFCEILLNCGFEDRTPLEFEQGA
jgi:hypothetical protein